MVKVKICGITTLEDAFFTADAGADLIGLNFYKQSPRYLAPEQAAPLVAQLRAELGEHCPLIIGVFVNEVVGTISALLDRVGLDAAQLSGDESDVMLSELRGVGFKAIRPMNEAQVLEDLDYFHATLPASERLPSLLIDAYHPKLYGGTGAQVAVELALKLKPHVPRLMVAGGLTPENVGQVVAAVQSWGVDVASGVESGQPGHKDHEKVRAFIQAAKSQEQY